MEAQTSSLPQIIERLFDCQCELESCHSCVLEILRNKRNSINNELEYYRTGGQIAKLYEITKRMNEELEKIDKSYEGISTRNDIYQIRLDLYNEHEHIQQFIKAIFSEERIKLFQKYLVTGGILSYVHIDRIEYIYSLEEFENYG